ncbi:hypothetical protein B0A49_09552 [Cryomyces minteri]|uniref:Cyclin N-terminal domain-containing protein n=1 Tax=Cryomyces minteri TaxID=331657 RepID=A0A4U0X164_9PEZI|nr:hypothetical protein B0A49_09552 [Cryomyces minteri]
MYGSSRPTARPQSPSFPQDPLTAPSSTQYNKSSTNNAIAPALQIPSTINSSQGSLTELAAQASYFLFSENQDATILEEIENPKSPSSPSSLVPDAIPSTGFRKWVTTILSTTQVAQNVILLALLFIYRLKMLNPAVKGKPGSEYRLLTVALMLGNKFLDDNTYTNKTWAEVSGISVMEVHIMEVEFLSNMRYGLFTSAAQWKDWHVKLGQFAAFIERASRLRESGRYLGPPTPSVYLPLALPSPPASNQASPPFSTAYSPNTMFQPNLPLLPPGAGSAAPSPARYLPELVMPNGRKRSLEDQSQEPPAKRSASHYAYPTYQNTSGTTTPSDYSSYVPRLQLPSLPVLQNAASSGHSSHAFVTLPPQLPPLSAPALSRAMSSVFPPPQTRSQPPSVSSAGMPLKPTPQPYAHDQSRRPSPYPSGSAGSSPTNTYPSQSAHTQNQSRLSPSYFLADRNSPYRPVRGVSTLLVPPPSAAVHHAPQNLGFDQMHYQPLGRPLNERRTGRLPYLPQSQWPESHAPTHWPTLPQPNFHS